MKKKAVVLLSGGLDSATVLALVKKNEFEVYALSFDYGQRHRFELDLAKNLALVFDIFEHKIIKMDTSLFSGSALTDGPSVPKPESLESIGEEIPVTYVPGRNTLFIASALCYAEVVGSQDIFIGVNALDYSGYPDCRPEYIAAFRALAKLSSKQAIEGQEINIHTPLIELKKSEIIKIGLDLGLDYGLTSSCYDPGFIGEPCRKCDSCLLRNQGFKENGLKDPRYSL